jgi:ABC-type polysaccharide/polyol phosphate transport system ATPase subunit
MAAGFSAARLDAMFHALNGVSFIVPKGEFVGVLRCNGAGKSTLLRAIGEVYATDSGCITIDGALSGLYELGVTSNPQRPDIVRSSGPLQP